MTPDMWHLTCETWWGVNIISSYGLGLTVTWTFWTKGSLNQSMNLLVTEVIVEHPGYTRSVNKCTIFYLINFWHLAVKCAITRAHLCPVEKNNLGKGGISYSEYLVRSPFQAALRSFSKQKAILNNYIKVHFVNLIATRFLALHNLWHNLHMFKEIFGA